MRWLEHRIPPPLVALIAAAAMSGVARAFPALPAPEGLRLALGLGLAGLGVACDLAGIVAFRRVGANVNPMRLDRGEGLATGGVYRFTRNPMYLGLALLLSGYALYQMRPLALLGPVAFVAYITRFQILPEERAMTEKFGAAYEDYRRRVRRWL
jgi:protein-S-isoprenylcysteine O-methyltransferase Ste14